MVDRPPPEDVVAQAIAKPRLEVIGASLSTTARCLRDLFAEKGERLFERGGEPVRLVKVGGQWSTEPLTKPIVIDECDRLCQPFRVKANGDVKEMTLPPNVAELYLSLTGEWHLRQLAGITSAPLLSSDGSIRVVDGYDPVSELFVSDVPQVHVPECPTRDDAKVALSLLRETFKTFPFEDSSRVFDPQLGVEVVDTKQALGVDESAFLTMLQTAVCRSSIRLAPGCVLHAPGISGAGTGKGLLTRSISLIAFGSQPAAIPRGHDAAELDKRLVAKLRQAAPVLFLDNLNSTSLHSETLSAILTERPAEVRILGASDIIRINGAPWVAITGNALTLSEDLVRRCIVARLDAKTEDPESRPFAPGFLEGVERARLELLSASLTIWRWGRQNTAGLARGKPFGSFEQWAEWVRDPLLTLGCQDPVERISEVKKSDPVRVAGFAVMQTWFDLYSDAWQTTDSIGTSVYVAGGLDEKANRQKKTAMIERLVGAQWGGFMLEKKKTANWTKVEYRVVKLVKDDEPDDTITAAQSEDASTKAESESGANGSTPPWRALHEQRSKMNAAQRRAWFYERFGVLPENCAPDTVKDGGDDDSVLHR